MSDDDEIQRLTEIERITNRKPSHLDMDEAFCARMHAAIAAGLEKALIGVITTPGTQNPKYFSDLTARYAPAQRVVNQKERDEARWSIAERLCSLAAS
jgi:hypothetical protein